MTHPGGPDQPGKPPGRPAGTAAAELASGQVADQGRSQTPARPSGQAAVDSGGFGAAEPRLGRPRPGGPAQRPGQAQRPQPTRQPDRELRHRALASLVLSVLALVALLGLGGDLHRGVYLLVFSAGRRHRLVRHRRSRQC